MLMRKMSDAMLVTPANVTGIIDRLEEKKLVRRTPTREIEGLQLSKLPLTENLYTKESRKRKITWFRRLLHLLQGTSC